MEQEFKGLIFSWIVTDNSIKYGSIFKKTIRLNEIGNMAIFPTRPPERWEGGTMGFIHIYRLTRDENRIFNSKAVSEDKGISLPYRYEQQSDAFGALLHIIENSRMSESDRVREKNVIVEIRDAVADGSYFKPLTSTSISLDSSTRGKDASVVGRAVVGGIIAGPAGAVVGALSAIDKNNKRK
ncbi:MAG: hypothetical protein J6J43_00665 [Oscillospiraceae bacterium]|nr:hypothetical protein [Oscillospiraceae bacterium]